MKANTMAQLRAIEPMVTYTIFKRKKKSAKKANEKKAGR